MPRPRTIRRTSTPAHAGLLLFCVAFFVQALGAQTPPASPVATPAFKDVTDEVGRTVRVPQPVLRIVSLAPSLTETIYALGLQERLVGDTDYCDYPPDAQKKPKVGGAINPSLEQIATLRPDLVLVTKSLNRFETVHALSDLGIPSYATDPHTVQEIISSTERLADVLGASQAGKALGVELEQHLSGLQQRLSGLPPRRVLFIVWSEPLISVGQNTFIADALRHAGAVSIVESSQDWPQMNLEEVVRLQPDYLVFAASHSDGAQNDFEALAQLPGWRGLEAVRRRRFAVISDAVNRPAPRIVSAIEELARQLHPEAFAAPPANASEKNPTLSQPNNSPGGSSSRAADSAAWEACSCAL
ncbi:MAG TPA: cobalamin-binding protein [Candidatus Methylomirabilis sp.]|nr:cobalamin-binding protein [Candidatus Methylomirabilis sp.]